MFPLTTLTNALAIAIALGNSPLSWAHPTATPASPHLSRAASSSKAGLAWPNGDSVDISQYASGEGKVSWYYSWSPYPTKTDLEFVPMLWGEKHIDEFTSTINNTIANNKVTAVLGMNEPQDPGQSVLTPQQGADMWKTHLEPLRTQNIRLGSPAPSSAPSGITWLQEFITLCDGCTVDFIALHWYGVNATQFISYVEKFHDTFQKPIWVTEWACHNFVDANLQCSQDDIVLFLNTTQSFMDESSFVERYSWFGAMKDMAGVNKLDALMDTSGKINDLGRQYIGGTPQVGDGAGSADGPTSTSSSGGFSPPKNDALESRGRFPSTALLFAFIISALLA